MKLDSLVQQDSLAVDPKEWQGIVGSTATLSSGDHMTLIGGMPLANGAYHLLFEYRAAVEVEVTGTRIFRTWVDGNIRKTRTVREDYFPSPVTVLAGGRIECEVIVEPGDWA